MLKTCDGRRGLRVRRRLARQRVTLVAAAIAAAGASGGQAFAQQLAFPGAEGFARHATGGRGGSVYIVTNLNDSGPGSFRDAVSQGNRTVVFEVSGYISLNSSIGVQDNITIAGQTAPGQGVAFRNYSVSFSNSSNTIARHIRMRHGLTPNVQGDSTGGDTLNNVILDHISAAWGRDETMSITNSTNVTVQNSIIAEGLLDHSMGGLVEWNTISMRRNLFIANNSRNPKAKGQMDFVNNVVSNWGTDAFIAGDSAGVSEANVVNNYFIRGASSRVQSDPFSRGNANYRMYLEGNFIDTNENGIVDGTLVTQATIDDVLTYMPTPYDYPKMTTVSAIQAYNLVVNRVGAFPGNRDTVDTRLVNNLVNQTGTTISDPASVGGWGTITGGVAPADVDRDGIADAWETARGMNPADINDRNNINAFGYTRQEEYINDLGAVVPDRTWSAASGNWPTAVNWVGGGTPTADEDAFVRSSGVATNGSVTVTATGAAAFRVYIGGNGLASAVGERVVVSGGSLTVVDGITVGHQNNATLDVSGGTLEAAGIGLGNVLNGTFAGTFNFTGGTVRTTRIGTTGTGQMNVSGGTIAPLYGTLTVTSNAALSGAGLTVDTGAGTASFSGVLSGAAGVTKLGSGALSLTGLNSYTGPTVIRGGTVSVGTLNNAGTASATGAATADASNLILDGARLLLLATSTTNRGLTVTEDGATLATNGALTLTVSGPIVSTGTGDRTLTFDLGGSASNISTFSGAITDPASGRLGVVKNGAGRLSFSGTAKTYSGDTVINNGTLLYFATNILPFGAGKGNLVINAPGIVDFRNGAQINGLFGNGSTIQGGGTSARGVTLGNGNADGAFSGSLGGVINLTKTGTGVQILSGTNGFTGTTTVSGGELRFGLPVSIGGTGASVTVSAAGIASAAYPIDQAFLARIATASTGTLALAASSANPLDLTVATGANLPGVRLGATVSSTYSGVLTPFDTAYRFGGGTSMLTLAGTTPLTGNRSVTVTAGGAVTLAAVTNHSGNTTIDGGELWLAVDNALPSGAAAGNVAVNNGGRLVLNANTTNLNALTGTGGTVTASGARTLVVGQNNADGTYSGVIAGAVSLTKAGNGTQTLAGSSSYTGATLVNAGVLRVTNASALGSVAGITTIVGGTTAGAALTASLSLDGGVTLAEPLTLAGRAGTSSDVPHVLSLSGTNTLASALTTATGGNNYNLQVDAGRLLVSANFVPSGGVTSVRFLKLQGAGTGDFTGSISNGSAVLSVTKIGSGHWTLSGSSAFTGDTTALAGRLTVMQPLRPVVGGLTSSGTGSVVLAAPAAAGAYTVAGQFAAVRVDVGGSVSLAVTNRSVHLPRVLITGGLSVGGTLDLANNDMIVRSGNAAAIGASIAAGLLRGSSAVAGTTLAVFPNGVGGGPVGYFATYDQVAVGAADVIVKYTYLGDANVDGVVNGDDFAALIEGFSTGGTGWAAGDFDYSGAVTAADFALYQQGLAAFQLNGSLGSGLSAGEGGTSGAIPEPSAMGLIALGGALSRVRRRRRA